MSDTPTPPIFYWIRDNWFWLSAIAICLAAAVWTWIKLMILNRISGISKQLGKVTRVIPVEALEKGMMLQTVAECDDRRAKCPKGITDVKLIEELGTDTKKLLTAMTMLINRLPLENNDREDISKELL